MAGGSFIFWNKWYLSLQFGKRSIKLIQLLSRVAISRTRFEKSDDDSSITSSSHEPQASSSCIDDHVDNNLGEKSDMENGARPVEGMSTHYYHRRGCSSSILPEVTLPPIRAERWTLKLCILKIFNFFFQVNYIEFISQNCIFVENYVQHIL